MIKNALVAQLDRVFDYESKGRGFEPLQARQLKHLGIAVNRTFRGVLRFVRVSVCDRKCPIVFKIP